MSRRRFIHLAASAGVALGAGGLAAACGGAESQSSTKKPAIRDRMKLPAVVSPELSLPALIAYAKGYFGEEGIEITDFVLGSGGTLRSAVIGKEYDFGLFGFVHVVLARLAGSPWKMLLSTHDLEIFSLIVRKELKGKVKTVADLRGRTVGFSTPGAASWVMGNAYLQTAGLNPDKDVQFLSLGADAGVIYTALQTGKVDAMSGWEPVVTRALESGVAYALEPIWDPKVQQKYLGSPDALALGLVTREDVIQSKPDLVQRMVSAHKKGLAFIASNSSSTIAGTVLGNKVTAQQIEGLNRDLVVKMIDRIKPGFKSGCLSKSGFQTEMDLNLKFKTVKSAITYDDFAHPKFAGTCS